uniref:Uncharacterized protein n=1 Tax=Apteryx owenii TaxID=8824 RepID=A0A8B9Q0F7_APTOW
MPLATTFPLDVTSSRTDCPLSDTLCLFLLQDVHDVIEKSRKAGVQAFVSVTEQENEFEKVIGLAERYPSSVVPCFGVHPIRSGAEGWHSATVQVGLDFTPWLVPTPQQREEQQRVLALQLAIEKRLDLPVNVHSRSAGRQTIAFLKKEGVQDVLLHNFAGRPSVALEGVQASYYFSFPPAVARQDQRAKLIKQIPLENICLETNSPSLGPNKEERNEPEKIRIVCQYIAALKGVSVERVCEVTTKNALKLFPKVKDCLKE